VGGKRKRGSTGGVECLCYVCHVLRKWKEAISDIEIEMILSEGWMVAPVQ